MTQWRSRTATQRAEDALVVSSRAAIHPHDPGNGAAPLVRQGAHRVRRSTEPEHCHRARGAGESNAKKYTAKIRRERHADRWRMATCLAGGCGLLATLLIFVTIDDLISYGGFWNKFLFYVAASPRRSHLEIWTLPSPLYLSVLLVFGYFVLVLRGACATWFASGYIFYGRLWTNFSIFYVAVNSNREVFVLHSV